MVDLGGRRIDVGGQTFSAERLPGQLHHPDMLPLIRVVQLLDLWISYINRVMPSTIPPRLFEVGASWISAWAFRTIGYAYPLSSLLIGLVFLSTVLRISSMAEVIAM